MSDGEQSAVHDLEHLTALALSLLRSVEDKDGAQRHLTYALTTFKGMWLNASSLLRLCPKSIFYSDVGEPVWNPAAGWALCRMMMEGCANFHYFVDDDVSPDELEFRGLVVDVQRVRDRLRRAGLPSVSAQVAAQSDVPEEARPEESDEEWHVRRVRELLPDELSFWLQLLEENAHFRCLDSREREQWVSGHFKGEGTQHRRDGFALDRVTRARSAGISSRIQGDVWGHLSSHVHIGPHALDQIRFFQMHDRIARRSHIEVPVRLCCGFLALAVRHFVRAFPQCNSPVNPELAIVLLACSELVMRDEV